MNGTVAPPSSRSTAAATWWSRTVSSAAIRLTIDAVLAGAVFAGAGLAGSGLAEAGPAGSAAVVSVLWLVTFEGGLSCLALVLPCLACVSRA
jgi:hypothetical protein